MIASDVQIDSPPDDTLEAVLALATASLFGEATPEEIARLEQLVVSDDRACRAYVDAMLDSRSLHNWSSHAAQEESPVPASPVLGFLGSFLDSAWQGTTGYFADHPGVFSYMVATVFFAVAALVASHVYMTEYQGQGQGEYVNRHGVPSAPSAPRMVKHDPGPAIVSVGRITGMVDCHWVDDQIAPIHDRVMQGAKFELASGLMEITYKTGARVILQGPCTYTAESAAGGYLSLGKLTARVESRSRLPSGTSRFRLPDGTSSGTSISRLPSGTSPTDRNATKSRPAGGTYFAVRTPTATVTDLGTEFGVEVDGRSGNTISHVFQGKVKVVTMAAGSQPSSEVVLGENQSARVEKSNAGAPSIITQNIAVKPGQFARADVLRELSLKQFRRWQRFSEELRRRDDLLAYYDFQRDADNPRDKNGAELLRNRAKTGPRFDGHVWGTLRMGMTQGRFPGKEALKFANPGDGVRVNIPVECTQMTVAAWVNIKQVKEYLGLLMSDDWKLGAVHWQIMQPGGERMTFSSDFAPNIVVASQPAFGDDVCRHWIHLAATHDSVTHKTAFYLNGRSIGESTVGSDVAFQFGEATIGAWWKPSEPRTFQGRMDELMIFNAVLSAEEIRRLHEGPQMKDF